VIQICFLEFKLGDNGGVAIFFAKAPSAVFQDCWTVCFGEEDEERPCCACEDGADPEGPTP
jgi:hypothetical protein